MAWDELIAIFQQNAVFAEEARTTRPVACPHDGTPLQENDEGVLNCPMGDFRCD